jgi:hypothetical protein
MLLIFMCMLKEYIKELKVVHYEQPEFKHILFQCRLG